MGSKKKKPVSPSLDESDAAPAETGKKTVNIEEEYKRLGSRPEGLTSDEAHVRLFFCVLVLALTLWLRNPI